MRRETRGELIDALRPKAEAVAHLLKHQRDFRTWGSGNDFNWWPENGNAQTKFQDGGKTLEFRHRWCGVKFRNFRPTNAKKADVVIHEPTFDEAGATVVAMHLVDRVNRTDKELRSSVSYSRATTDTTSTEIAHSVGVALTVATEAKVKAGGDAFGGSVEQSISVALETSYNFTKSDSESHSKSEESATVDEFIVPPQSAVSASLMSKIGKGEIRIDVTAYMDMEVEVWSHEDWTLVFPSLEVFKDYVTGHGNEDIFMWDVFQRGPYSETHPKVVEACAYRPISISVTSAYDRALKSWLDLREVALPRGP